VAIARKLIRLRHALASALGSEYRLLFHNSLINNYLYIMSSNRKIIDHLFPIRPPKTIETATVADTSFGDYVTSVSASSHWKPYRVAMERHAWGFVSPHLFNLETFLIAPISNAEKACVEHIKTTIALYTYAVDLPKRLFSTGNAGLTTTNVDKQQPVDMGKFKVQAQAAVLAADRALDELMAFVATHQSDASISRLCPSTEVAMFRGVQDIQTHIQIDNSYLTYMALRPYIRDAYLSSLGRLPMPMPHNIEAYNQLAPAYTAQVALIAWLKNRQTNVLIELNGYRALSNMEYMNRTEAAMEERQKQVEAKIKAMEADNQLKYSALRRLFLSSRPPVSTVRDGQSNVVGMYKNRR
jgi:hypothetical protein